MGTVRQSSSTPWILITAVVDDDEGGRLLSASVAKDAGVRADEDEKAVTWKSSLRTS